MAKEILKISSDEYFALPKLSNSAIKDFRNEGSWTYYHRYVKSSLAKTKESDAQHRKYRCVFLLLAADSCDAGMG